MDAAIRGKSGRESGANRSLRVALDGRNLQLSEGTGVATYGRCVVESLERLGLQAELVVDTARVERDVAATAPLARARRWLRALLPTGAHARAIDPRAPAHENNSGSLRSISTSSASRCGCAATRPT